MHNVLYVITPSSTPDDESEWNCFVCTGAPSSTTFMLNFEMIPTVVFSALFIECQGLMCLMSNATWHAPELFIVTTGLLMWLPLFTIVSTMTIRRTTMTSRWTTRPPDVVDSAAPQMSINLVKVKSGPHKKRSLRYWSLTLNTTLSQIKLFSWSPNSP